MTTPSDPPLLHRKTIRLSYADCDPSDILYFATWFPAMERVQAEWYFLNGFRQDRLLAEQGFSTITRATEAEYLVPAGLFDEIEISLYLGHLGRTSVRSELHMVRLSDHARVARGSITLVTVDPQGRPTPVPDALRALYRTGSDPGLASAG